MKSQNEETSDCIQDPSQPQDNLPRLRACIRSPVHEWGCGPVCGSVNRIVDRQRTDNLLMRMQSSDGRDLVVVVVGCWSRESHWSLISAAGRTTGPVWRALNRSAVTLVAGTRPSFWSLRPTDSDRLSAAGQLWSSLLARRRHLRDIMACALHDSAYVGK